jgi:hypothetical protein
MHDSASFEIKALLTLALLKSGTSAKDIQTAVDLASTARIMAAEEYLRAVSEEVSDTNVTNLKGARPHGAAGQKTCRHELEPGGLNSDIKALLSLLLLQAGATSQEIVTTMRMAAAAHAAGDAEIDPDQMIEADVVVEPPPAAARQTLRSERLAPVARTVRAA